MYVVRLGRSVARLEPPTWRLRSWYDLIAHINTPDRQRQGLRVSAYAVYFCLDVWKILTVLRLTSSYLPPSTSTIFLRILLIHNTQLPQMHCYPAAQCGRLGEIFSACLSGPSSDKRDQHDEKNQHLPRSRTAVDRHRRRGAAWRRTAVVRQHYRPPVVPVDSGRKSAADLGQGCVEYATDRAPRHPTASGWPTAPMD